MFTKFSLFKGRIYRLKTALVLIALLFVTGAHGTPIIKNQVEDTNILISQFVGGQPDVLVILDLSGSMGRNYGGTEVGNWDSSDAFFRCEDSGTGNGHPNILASHCAEEMAGTAVCGTANCGEDGRCDTQTELSNQITCVSAKAPSFNMCLTLQTICGGAGCSQATQTAFALAHCTSTNEMEDAAAAVEAAAGLTQCMSGTNCKLSGDPNPACDTNPDYNRFKSCMQNLQNIGPNKVPACTGGTPNCQGTSQFGSSRLDMALDVFYSILDADNSLSTKTCSDPGKLFDGVNTNINCKNFMETPFRDVGPQVQGTGSGFKLPTTPQEGIIDELTNTDAQLLGLRLRPLTYSGASWAGCTSNNTFQLAQGGFAGKSQSDLQNVWKFFRGSQANGGTPLALVLGLDDNNGNGGGGGNVINNDAPGVYKVELQTDTAISCRPEFVIVITDGEDTCSGDCNATSGSCNGGTTTNANRRSSTQAVSNLRTYYVRNPVSNGGQTFKKEVLTFVIGIGVRDDQVKRTLNAMALAGGTHTKGLIQHTAPDGTSIGTVDINDVLPNLLNTDVFRNLAMAIGIDSSTPSSAQLQGCKTPQETGGSCSFQSKTIFDDNFFNTGQPFTSFQPLENFAFFADNAQELSTALQTILQFIKSFSTSGVSPTAPQSSTSVALRDRVFLSILTPISTSRIWQGRLGLYAFIDDPSNIGAKRIVDDTPQQNPIFNSNGSLNQFAQNFYWEAGKNLAERNLSTSPRNLFSVDITNSSTVDTVTNSGKVVSIRYRGERAAFDDNLPPSLFGIAATDVTDPIPDFCNTGGIRDCSSNCSVVTSTACQNCVELCIRDDIVSFMSGNTDTQPVEDPMGTMGTNCPDPETGTGSLATCSLRLGDIFHSTPVVVGSPSPLFFDVGFQNFGAAFQNRTGVVYVGANDGFLHAFNAGDFVNASSTNPQKNPFTLKDESLPFFSAGDGKELFGFAPPSFLPDSLSPPSPQGNGSAPSGFGPPDFRFGDHKTFVTDEGEPERSFIDGTPLIADVWIDGYQNGIQNNASCTSTPNIDGTIDPCGKEWHSVLLSGFRNGGGAYIALDITNVDKTQTTLKKFSSGPDYPRHLWTVFDKNFGNVWSDPTIGRVKMKTKDNNGNVVIVDRWVMFVGGGADPTIPPESFNASNGVTFGNAFYVIDIATGNIIFKFAHDSISAPNATVTDSRMICDMPSKVGAFDLNGDGFIEVVYEGDTCGRLWRFDVSQPIFDAGNDITKTGLRGTANITAKDPSSGNSVWTGDIAFCANTSQECTKANNVPTTNRQPIFFAPTVVLDDLGQRHVIFLTGDRRDPSNFTNSTTGTAEFGKLYNFIDSFIPAFLAGGTAVTASMQTEGNFTSGQIIKLVPQSGVANQFTTSGGSTVNNQGQFIVIFPSNVTTPNGEKGFGSPVVVNRVLIFTTFAPNTNLTNPCTQTTGVGNIFSLDYLSGQPALVRIPGAQNLIQGSSSQQNAAAGLTAAQGMPTPAQLTFGARGSVVLTVAFTGNATTGGSQFLVWQLPPFPARTQTLFWEEIL